MRDFFEFPGFNPGTVGRWPFAVSRKDFERDPLIHDRVPEFTSANGRRPTANENEHSTTIAPHENPSATISHHAQPAPQRNALRAFARCQLCAAARERAAFGSKRTAIAHWIFRPADQRPNLHERLIENSR